MYMGTMCRHKPEALEEEEEALGVIWRQQELGHAEEAAIAGILAEGISPQVLGRLKEKGLALVSAGRLELGEEGRRLAVDVTRRHRLAERLLVDLLDMEPKRVDESACRLEHILTPEAAEAICTLLGHPRHCPHGTPIPPGDCCQRSAGVAEPVITTLDRLTPGAAGRVAYLALPDKVVLQKLLSLGLTPGSEVALKQKEPSIVVQTGETVIALEKELGAHIAVRRNPA